MSATAVLYTDYTAAGGQRLGTLVVVDGTERSRIDGNETTSLVVDRARWVELGGDVRMVVRVTWPDGAIVERRISQIGTTDEAAVTALELVPVFADLGTGGPILRVVAGAVATRLAGELPFSVIVSSYVLPHAAAQRIGLVLGTIEKDVVIPFDLDAPTPAALLSTCSDTAKLELEVVRTSDTVWTLNARIARGSTVPALTVRSTYNQAQLALSVNDQQFATSVVPLGESHPETGDRATVATARWAVASIASGWVQLRDPGDLTQSPIRVATQWVGAWVVDRNGFAQEILDARTSDGAVQLAVTAPLTTGDRVWIAADATGTPLAEVYDATAVGARRRVVPLPLPDVRGEANELRNGRFLTGLEQWTGANPTSPPAFAEVLRSELGTTITGQASAARSAGVGTGTAFGIKNLPANAFVRQWAEIKVGGATLPVTADAIPDASGALTLALGGGGLPGAYADDTPLTLVRGESRTLTLDGAQSPLTPALQFRDSNTDALALANTGTLTNGTYSGPFGGVDYVDAPLRAGRVRLQTANSINNQGTLTWASYASDVYTLVNPVLAYTVGASTGTITYDSAATAPIVGTRIRYIAQNTQWQMVRVTSISGLVLSVVTEDGAPIGGWSFTGNFQACNIVLADGTTFTVAFPRETRTLRLNGAQIAGATSVPFKAQSNIATRNWVATDTISAARALSAVLAVTGISSTVGFTSGGSPVIGMQATVTYNAGTSTIDDLTLGTDWSVGEVAFDLGTAGLWVLQSIGGGTAVLNNYALWYDPAPFTTPQTVTAAWVRTDTYALTGTASWGTNGRVTLNLASAVPAGRSYARGTSVTANWVAGALRLHVTLAAAATTVQLQGEDFFFVASSPTASLGGSVYRVFTSASTVPIPGNTLYAAGTVQADGSGNASVTITAANPNAIALNEAVTITTPAMLRPTDDTLGSVVRLMAPVGGSNIPSASTPGLIPIRRVTIPVPTGTTVPITAFVTFALSAGTYALGSQPAVALVDSAGAVLAWARLADTTAIVAQTPTIARIILPHTLTATTALTLCVYGGHSDKSLWTVAVDALLSVTTRDDVPFVVGSWANVLAIRGADELAARRDPAVAVSLDIATLRRWSDAPASAPVVIGQQIVLPAYGLTRRVLGIDRSLLNPDRVRVEVGVPTDDLSTQVGAS